MNFDPDIIGVHETIVHKLLSYKKVPRNSYNLFKGSHTPDKRYSFWDERLPIPVTINWEKVHYTNFFCTIDTKLRSFYFKIFHKAIALNDFLYKIKSKDSPNCVFCDKSEETIVHLFCECERVIPIWQSLLLKISQNNVQINGSNFEKMFGLSTDKFISYLFLLLKYYIHTCKFKNNLPSFALFKTFVKKQQDLEYLLAKKRNKLPAHFKKWRFTL